MLIPFKTQVQSTRYRLLTNKGGTIDGPLVILDPAGLTTQTVTGLDSARGGDGNLYLNKTTDGSVFVNGNNRILDMRDFTTALTWQPLARTLPGITDSFELVNAEYIYKYYAPIDSPALTGIPTAPNINPKGSLDNPLVVTPKGNSYYGWTGSGTTWTGAGISGMGVLEFQFNNGELLPLNKDYHLDISITNRTKGSVNVSFSYNPGDMNLTFIANKITESGYFLAPTIPDTEGLGVEGVFLMRVWPNDSFDGTITINNLSLITNPLNYIYQPIAYTGEFIGDWVDSGDEDYIYRDYDSVQAGDSYNIAANFTLGNSYGFELGIRYSEFDIFLAKNEDDSSGQIIDATSIQDAWPIFVTADDDYSYLRIVAKGADSSVGIPQWGDTALGYKVVYTYNPNGSLGIYRASSQIATVDYVSDYAFSKNESDNRFVATIDGVMRGKPILDEMLPSVIDDKRQIPNIQYIENQYFNKDDTNRIFAPLDSPTFIGHPTVPTPDQSDEQFSGALIPNIDYVDNNYLSDFGDVGYGKYIFTDIPPLEDDPDDEGTPSHVRFEGIVDIAKYDRTDPENPIVLNANKNVVTDENGFLTTKDGGGGSGGLTIDVDVTIPASNWVDNTSNWSAIVPVPGMVSNDSPIIGINTAGITDINTINIYKNALSSIVYNVSGEGEMTLYASAQILVDLPITVKLFNRTEGEEPITLDFMKQEIYDPQEKEEDIFAYSDNKLDSANQYTDSKIVTVNSAIEGKISKTGDSGLSGIFSLGNGNTGMLGTSENRWDYIYGTYGVFNNIGATSLSSTTLTVRNVPISIGVGYDFFVGRSASTSANSGGGNIGIGESVLMSMSSTMVASSIGIGQFALSKVTTGGGNTAIGASALSNVTTGSNNLAFGLSALSGVTTGAGNIGIGWGTGVSTITGVNNILIGNGAELGTSSGTNQIVIGTTASGAGSNSIVLGNNQITQLRCQVTTITSLSDERVKEDIELADTNMCLDAVNNIPLSRYKYKDFTGAHLDSHVSGWMADDIEKIFPKSVTKADKEFPILDENGNVVKEKLVRELPDGTEEEYEKTKTFLMKDVKEITPTEMLPTLWGAVQELSKKVDALEARITELEKED